MYLTPFFCRFLLLNRNINKLINQKIHKNYFNLQMALKSNVSLKTKILFIKHEQIKRSSCLGYLDGV
jgi:hypothetical protein